MIHDLKLYPAYKNSGVPWLGEVPGHWEVRRLKTVFREVDKRTTTGDQTLLSLRMQTGLVDHHALGGKRIPPASLVGYKLTQPGEIVMNRMRAAAGLFAATPMAGIVSPDYAVLRPTCAMTLAYFVHLFRTPAMTSIFRVESHGLGTGESGFLRLYTDRFGMLPAPVPSPAEQSAIVRFLDHADRRIRRYIAAKKKLMALLNEQKQAIIHHAVTRGLDPSVRLKPSGVDWLGDVPDHWEVIALRHLASKFGSGVTPKGGAQVYQTEGVLFLRSQNIHFGGLMLDGVARISRALHDEMSGTHVRPFDVLLNITGASIGRVCHVPIDFVEGNVNQHVCIIRPRRTRMSAPYLAAFLSTPGIQTEIYLSQNGSSREGLTLQSIRDLPVLVPPQEEQNAIVAWVKDQTNTLDAAAAQSEREICLLREYRTRLIADVVSGRLDVREAAARLPDEAEEPEPLDETGVVAEGDEEIEAAAEEAEA